MTSFYDPLLMKVMVVGDSRPQAIHRMIQALSEMKILGLQTNLDYLSALWAFATGETLTTLCNSFVFRPSSLEVVKAGMYSFLPNRPGREGLWSIGVPPSVYPWITYLV